jgi:hypothetical protein
LSPILVPEAPIKNSNAQPVTPVVRLTLESGTSKLRRTLLPTRQERSLLQYQASLKSVYVSQNAVHTRSAHDMSATLTDVSLWRSSSSRKRRIPDVLLARRSASCCQTASCWARLSNHIIAVGVAGCAVSAQVLAGYPYEGKE